MRLLKNRLLCNLTYFFLWVVYFLFARFLFLCYYLERGASLSFLTKIKTFYHGLKLDFSFAAYLSAIPFLLLLFSVFIPKKIINAIIKPYTFILVFIISLLMIIDIVLYKAWGVRIDATLLNYINTPKIMLASVSGFTLFFGIVIWITLSLLICYCFNTILKRSFNKLEKGKLWELPVFFIVLGSLILPVRGGFQTIPINQSNVYFSKQMFANHAAVNFIWNFTNTLTHRTGTKNPYKHFKPKTAKDIISKTKNLLLTGNDSILKIPNPNVILIIWESLSAKAVGVLGGVPNATENLNRLAKEGVLFSNFYGNGDRTDKGLAAILSGYYPQPTRSIIKMPKKTQSLPILTQEMKNLGYTTSFYYGGDSNFGNMITYLRNGNIDKIVDGTEFDKDDWNSKWGAHDHIFLERVMKDLSAPQLKKPFFTTALTLTSHEPYEFPDEYKFGKDSEENKYLSAQAYTDKAIGKFIEDAKKQSWWDTTLIVIMADHGHPLPKHEGYFNSPKRFKIPMVWLGGALAKKNTTVANFSSQADFAYTLTKLLNGNAEQFTFSNHIFSNNPDKQYVHYVFNKGFGTIDKSGTFVFDYVSKKPVLEIGNYKHLDSLGKAISQEAYQDFLDR